MPDAQALIGQVILTGTQTSVVFSNLPQTYKDLRLVLTTSAASGGSIWVRANGDAGSNYTQVTAYGNGSTSGSNTGTISGLFLGYNLDQMSVMDIMDYSTTDKHKGSLCKNNAVGGTQMTVSRWANTAAITSLTVVIEVGSFSVGSTFILYGVSA